MLTQLDIRNIVLIEHLRLDLTSGLSVLTGETGAGKSILLDALGLVRGDRMDTGLIRTGADQAMVTAVFDIPDAHGTTTILHDQGIEPEAGQLTLRRVLSRDGKSRAFVNDQPISLQLLKNLGQMVIDIHGQFDTGRLFDPAYHRDLVDGYGHLIPLRVDVAAAFDDLQTARADDATLRDTAAMAARDEDYIRTTLEALDALDPQVGEEEKLLTRKKYLTDSAQIMALVSEAQDLLGGDDGVETMLGRTARVLERMRGKWPEMAAPWLSTVDQALEHVRDVIVGLDRARSGDDGEAQNIDQVEDRLYDLRGFARRLNVTVDELAQQGDVLRAQLDLIRDQSDALATSAARVQKAESVYLRLAGTLTQKRVVVAKKLDQAVMKELPPLKLDKAIFQTAIEPLSATNQGPLGLDRVQFMVATNPGSAPAPLDRIASGGELSRLMLALKVVAQSTKNSAQTLIFDEVDAGLGGAVAAALAERLKRLSTTSQVLVVTHAPQVAAVADHHYVVEKSTARNVTTTSIEQLSGDKVRREEIARMLSGAKITDEARAAAARLLDDKVA